MEEALGFEVWYLYMSIYTYATLRVLSRPCSRVWPSPSIT
jgi:hypothetical protein